MRLFGRALTIGDRPSRDTASARNRTIFRIGGTEHDSEELRLLLYQRMRLLYICSTLLMLSYFIRLCVEFGLGRRVVAGQFVISLLFGTIYASFAALLWMRKTLTLESLRRIELFLLLCAGTGVYAQGWGFLRRGGAALAPLPASLKPLTWAWAVYPDGSFHIDSAYVSLTPFVIINFSLLIIGYGVFIPNTWRRCFAAIVFLIALAELCIVQCFWRVPELRAQLGPACWVVFYLLGFASLISLYGCNKLTELRQVAEQAREVGQYMLEQRIGHGGMGEVYRARHRLLRRPCAVKLIRPEQAGSPDMLVRFEREVQSMAQLTHPNTVEIYDYGRARDGTFYYAMEYLPGMTLESLVKKAGPLPPSRAIYLLRQICRALRESHTRGLIHRDIKPGNIFITERGGEYDVAKLLDFGLVAVQAIGEPTARPMAAAAGSAASESPNLTQDGHVLGTPAFMAPEQITHGAIDARSDIYSLGTVAYFALTGHAPFERPSVSELLHAHLSAAPQPLSALLPDGAQVPADLEAVVLRCMAKRPEERYGSAAELEVALNACSSAGGWDAEHAELFWRSMPSSKDLATAMKDRGEEGEEGEGSDASRAQTIAPAAEST